MPKREGNNPKRRIAPRGALSPESLARLVSLARYGGSANHKRRPGDYGFSPAQNPRPSKSLCDGLRTIPRQEAETLLARGIAAEMLSMARVGDFPKFIWAVDDAREAYEAKIGEDGASYHGYRLGHDEREFRRWVIETWTARHATE